MEGFYGNSNQRVPKLINTQMDAPFFIADDSHYYRSKSPIFDPHASDVVVDSSLVRYLRSRSPASRVFPGVDLFPSPSIDPAKRHYNPLNRSGDNPIGFSSRGGSAVASPLSAVENMRSPMARSPAAFGTPLKAEEDVLVMDGIPVVGRVRSSVPSDSGWSSAANGLYKTEICRAWEDYESCRYGSKCQFAHGKEELRPTRFPNKNKLEGQLCKSYITKGSCIYSSKCRFLHHSVPLAAAGSPINTSIDKTVRRHQASGTSSNNSVRLTSWNYSWLPQDDGIQSMLPSPWTHDTLQSAEQTEAFINAVLYGDPLKCKRRLPVFTEMCLDE